MTNEALLNKVTQGDCLEVMRGVADKSVNLIVIDPPYNIGIKGEAWDKYKPEEYFDFMNAVFKECERVLTPNGSFYWFHNDMPQIARLMIELNQNTSFVYNSFITWDKGDWRALSWKNPSEKSNLRSWFNTAEYCLLYTFSDVSSDRRVRTGEKRMYLQLKEYFRSEKEKCEKSGINVDDFVPHTSNFHYFANGASFNLPSKRNYLKLQETGYFYKSYSEVKDEYDAFQKEYEALKFTHNLDADHKNVWHYKSENTGKYHACQKPLSVIDRIIKTSSNPGDIVLDCFGGSGTTAVSALNNDRQFILIEREQEYVDIANKRIADAIAAKETEAIAHG